MDAVIVNYHCSLFSHLQSGMHHLILQQAPSLLNSWPVQPGAKLDFEAFSAFHMEAPPVTRAAGQASSNPSSTQVAQVHEHSDAAAIDKSRNLGKHFLFATTFNQRDKREPRYDTPPLDASGNNILSGQDGISFRERDGLGNQPAFGILQPTRATTTHATGPFDGGRGSKPHSSSPEDTALDTATTNKSGGSGGSGSGSGNTSGAAGGSSHGHKRHRRSPRAGERRKKAKPVPSDDH